VPSLADLQTEMRQALVSARAVGVAPFLVGGADPLKRLAIHQRHYDTSLVTSLLEKLPACGWLLGSSFLTQAAHDFVRVCPPNRPCLAEYGDSFPAFLAAYEGATVLPYVRAFAELEWHIGQVSIAIAQPALTWSDVAGIGVDALPDAVLTLQPGLRHVEASWAVDDLMRLYLTDAALPRFDLASGDIWIEVTGARGELHIGRVDRTTLVFRESILFGRSLTEAVERALEHDAAFDPVRGLTELVASGLVTAVTRQVEHAV
jgi:hypothetical protein